MAKEYKDLVVGLDIGTAKVMAVVAEVLPGGELRVEEPRVRWTDVRSRQKKDADKRRLLKDLPRY